MYWLAEFSDLNISKVNDLKLFAQFDTIVNILVCLKLLCLIIIIVIGVYGTALKILYAQT